MGEDEGDAEEGVDCDKDGVGEEVGFPILPC